MLLARSRYCARDQKVFERMAGNNNRDKAWRCESDMAEDAGKQINARTTTALLEALQAINSSLDLHRTLQAIASSAAKVMRAEASSVLLLDKSGKKLTFKAAVGQRADLLLEQERNCQCVNQLIHEYRPRDMLNVLLWFY